MDLCRLVVDLETVLKSDAGWEHLIPIREDHPSLRCLYKCPCCGLCYVYDFMDAAEWGGIGDGLTLYAPVIDEETDQAMSEDRATLLHRVPRLEVQSLEPFKAEWVTA